MSIASNETNPLDTKTKIRKFLADKGDKYIMRGYQYFSEIDLEKEKDNRLYYKDKNAKCGRYTTAGNAVRCVHCMQATCCDNLIDDYTNRVVKKTRNKDNKLVPEVDSEGNWKFADVRAYPGFEPTNAYTAFACVHAFCTGKCLPRDKWGARTSDSSCEAACAPFKQCQKADSFENPHKDLVTLDHCDTVCCWCCNSIDKLCAMKIQQIEAEEREAGTPSARYSILGQLLDPEEKLIAAKRSSKQAPTQKKQVSVEMQPLTAPEQFNF
jgi:hypothetical protein